MITRVQSATTSFTVGTAGVVTLGAAPSNNNTLVAVVAQQSVSNPVVTSVVQTGVQWSLHTTTNGPDITVEFWIGRVLSGAATTITVTTSSADETAIAVAEYSDVVDGVVVDESATATGDSNSPYSGQTAVTNQAQEVWLGSFATRGGDIPLTLPPSDFTEVAQVASGGDRDDDVRAGLYERYIAATGQAHVTLQTSFAVPYAGQVFTLFESLAAAAQVSVPLTVLVAATSQVVTALSVYSVVTDTRAVSLEVSLRSDRSTSLDMLVGADGFHFAALDILLDLGVDAALDMSIVGPNNLRVADLDMQVVFRPVRFAQLNLVVSTTENTRRAALDVAILRPKVPSNNITSPANFRYLDCRPLWCQVPRVRNVSAQMSVGVDTTIVQTADLGVTVAEEVEVVSQLEVLMDP